MKQILESDRAIEKSDERSNEVTADREAMTHVSDCSCSFFGRGYGIRVVLSCRGNASKQIVSRGKCRRSYLHAEINIYVIYREIGKGDYGEDGDFV